MSNESDLLEILKSFERGDEKPPMDQLVGLISRALDNLDQIRKNTERIASLLEQQNAGSAFRNYEPPAPAGFFPSSGSKGE